MSRRRPLDWGWVIGLPMAALGLAAAVTAVRFALGSQTTEAAGLATLAIVLGGIGAAWLVTSLRANRDTIRRNRLAAAHPDEPWRWRPDWDARRIVHANRRFGATVLELATLPGRIGGTLSGEIVPAFRDHPTGGFTVTLRALHRYVTGAGKRRRMHEDVLWEDSRTVPVSSSGSGLKARFDIPIPDRARESNDDHPNDEIVWRVLVSADVGGRPFTSWFDVPVFRG